MTAFLAGKRYSGADHGNIRPVRSINGEKREDIANLGLGWPIPETTETYFRKTGIVADVTG